MNWYFNELAKKEIKNYIEENHEHIKVKGGNCRYNYKCHMNAVHEAIEHKHKRLVMCVYIDDGYPIIHFLNYDKGDFIDNTLGHWATQHKYYLIKFIEEKDFFNISNIFLNYRQELRNKLRFFTKLLSNTIN